MRGDGVDVGGGVFERQMPARKARRLDHALQQKMRAIRAVRTYDGAKRIQPFLRFGRV